MENIKNIQTKTFTEEDTLDDVGLWLGQIIDFKEGNGQPPFNLMGKLRITVSEI